jgi:hypothetical protein
MYDEENRLFVWEASGLKDIKVGETVNVAGTMKAPDKFYSQKHGKEMVKNVITRCTFHTLEELEELAKKPAPKAKKAKAALEESPAPF